MSKYKFAINKIPASKESKHSTKLTSSRGNGWFHTFSVPVPDGNTPILPPATEENFAPSRHLRWPKLAEEVLLEIMTELYSFLINETDTHLKQLSWSHAVELLKAKIKEHQTSPDQLEFASRVEISHLQNKWQHMKERFAKRWEASRNGQHLTHSSEDDYVYHRMAQITQDDPSVQPKMFFEIIDYKNQGRTRHYNKYTNSESTEPNENPETTPSEPLKYLTLVDVRKHVIQKALHDRYTPESRPQEEQQEVKTSPDVQSPVAPLYRPTPSLPQIEPMISHASDSIDPIRSILRESSELIIRSQNAMLERMEHMLMADRRERQAQWEAMMQLLVDSRHEDMLERKRAEERQREFMEESRLKRKADLEEVFTKVFRQKGSDQTISIESLTEKLPSESSQESNKK